MLQSVRPPSDVNDGQRRVARHFEQVSADRIESIVPLSDPSPERVEERQTRSRSFNHGRAIADSA
jgi:hypothetical protein